MCLNFFLTEKLANKFAIYYFYNFNKHKYLNNLNKIIYYYDMMYKKRVIRCYDKEIIDCNNKITNYKNKNLLSINFNTILNMYKQDLNNLCNLYANVGDTQLRNSKCFDEKLLNLTFNLRVATIESQPIKSYKASQSGNPNHGYYITIGYTKPYKTIINSDICTYISKMISHQNTSSVIHFNENNLNELIQMSNDDITKNLCIPIKQDYFNDIILFSIHKRQMHLMQKHKKTVILFDATKIFYGDYMIHKNKYINVLNQLLK